MLKLARVLAVVLISLGSASGSTILKYDFDFGDNAPPPAAYPHNGPLSGDFLINPFQLPQFNVPGVMLTKIEFLLNITDMDGSIDVRNTSPFFDYNYTGRVGIDVSMLSTDALLLAQSITLIPASTVPINKLQHHLFEGLNVTDVSPGLVTYQGSSLTPEIEAKFRGSGTVDFMLYGQVSQTVTGGPWDLLSKAVFTQGQASILYTYDTPEPALMSMIGSGLLGLALLMRSSRKPRR